MPGGEEGPIQGGGSMQGKQVSGKEQDTDSGSDGIKVTSADGTTRSLNEYLIQNGDNLSDTGKQEAIAADIARAKSITKEAIGIQEQNRIAQHKLDEKKRIANIADGLETITVPGSGEQLVVKKGTKEAELLKKANSPKTGYTRPEDSPEFNPEAAAKSRDTNDKRIKGMTSTVSSNFVERSDFKELKKSTKPEDNGLRKTDLRPRSKWVSEIGSDKSFINPYAYNDQSKPSETQVTPEPPIEEDQKQNTPDKINPELESVKVELAEVKAAMLLMAEELKGLKETKEPLSTKPENEPLITKNEDDESTKPSDPITQEQYEELMAKLEEREKIDEENRKIEEQKKERRRKRVALIVGVAVGTAAFVALGPAVFAIGMGGGLGAHLKEKGISDRILEQDKLLTKNRRLIELEIAKDPSFDKRTLEEEIKKIEEERQKNLKRARFWDTATAGLFGFGNPFWGSIINWARNRSREAPKTS